MPYSIPNASEATGTRLRTPRSVSHLSGLCATCLDGCPGPCEIGMSAYRATEVLYPQPFGQVTAGAEKQYPLDLSHFAIQGSAVGAAGVEADPDHAAFPNVRISVSLGHDGGIKLNYPIVIPGLGSTDVAAKNFEHLAAGAAITGTLITVGENVCGMDDEAEYNNGTVRRSPDLERRVQTFQKWQQNGAGGIVVQENVEDNRGGVLEYAIRELGVDKVELKWGQGAKDIGGEVKIVDLAKAQRLKSRNYIVLPDPENPDVVRAFQRGEIREFERHSRLGMVSEEGFLRRVEQLRAAGARYIFLKTGAYRPADLARAVKFASKAKVDVLTVDGAGGGTGMSPWRMMNEWGIPFVEIATLTYQYCSRLAAQGEHVPDIVLAGGISSEDQIFKALALGAPFVKAVGMARAAMTAAFVGKNIGLALERGELKAPFMNYGSSLDTIFLLYWELEEMLGERVKELPTGAMGMYHYFRRLGQGLRQLMAGARKFALEYLTRDDLAALTREAAEVSGITYVMDVDKQAVDEILGA